MMMLESQAGTYIKEFVHGDLGRTHPRYEKTNNLSFHLLLQLNCYSLITLYSDYLIDGNDA
jgi:hypothetical protein